MKTLYGIILLILFLASCEDIYLPDIETQQSHYVFEGLLTNEPGVHFVRITKSMAYTNTTYIENATRFNVKIESASGEVITLREMRAGYYITDSTSKGIPGHSYRLVATNPEGDSFVSDYEPLLPAASINNLSAVYYQEKKLEIIEGTGQVELTYGGIQITAASVTQGFTPYYRYEYDAVIQTTQTYPTQPMATIYYIVRPWGSVYKGLVSLVDASQYQNQFISNFTVDFIPASQYNAKIPINEIEFDGAGNTVFGADEIDIQAKGIILKLKQYSLSESGYRFWKSINNQINSSGKLFYPVAPQIKGNIVCTSDSNEMVFGYFGVSAINQSTRYFYQEYNNKITTKKIIYFPKLTETRYNKSSFDFWMD